MTPTTATLTLSLARSGGVALGLSLSTGPSMVPGVGSSAGTSTAAGGGAARWAAAGLAGGTSTAAGGGRATGPAVVAAAILARSPIAYWKLDETSGAVAADSSGNGRNGAYSASGLTLGGSFAPFVAPTFDGTNGIVNLYSVSIVGVTPTATGSIVLFARAGDTASRAAILIGSGSQPVEQIRIARTGVALRTGERNDLGGAKVATESAALTVDLWEPLALTWGAGVIRLYRNGVEVATGSGTFNPWFGGPSTSRWVVGGIATNSTANRWLGQIAHVALFSTVLSAADIAAIYAASGL